MALRRYCKALTDNTPELIDDACVWSDDTPVYSENDRVGGLIALRARYPTSPRFGIFAEVEGKTEGWVAGNAHLDPNIGFRVGGSVQLQ